MKIEIEVDDIQMLFNGLNNAIILLGNDTWAKFIGCKSEEKLSSIPYELQEKRLNVIKKFYNDIYEKYKDEIEI